MRSQVLFGFLLAAAGLIFSPPLRAQLVDMAIMHSTVMITSEVDPSDAHQSRRSNGGPMVSHATGFLMFQGLKLTHGQIFLITNKHILPPEGKQREIKVRVVVRDTDGASRVEDVSVPVTGADGKYLPSVRMHPNPETDVAAINIATTAFGSKFQLLIDAITTGKRLDTSMLLSMDQLRSAKIGMGSSVYVLGFPAALYDPRNVSPVLRMGVISTDPEDGYTFNDELRQTTGLPKHIDGFLIDSNVYPGSSGSLVIAGPESQPRKSPGTAKAAPKGASKSGASKGSGSAGVASGGADKDTEWQPYIVGIVAGSIPIFDAPLRSYERIGLGIVYSANTIREVIQQFDTPRVSSQR
jgi:hypothetical protein